MDKSIQAGQIWKRKKDGVYIIILEYDGKRWIKVRRADTRRHWQIEDWGLRRKYFLPDQEYLCRPCITGVDKVEGCTKTRDCI